MVEKELMPKRTVKKSRRKRHKYSFTDFLIFLFACSIFGGAIYYFFIIDKNQEQGIETTIPTKSKSKSDMKSKNLKNDSQTKNLSPKMSDPVAKDKTKDNSGKDGGKKPKGQTLPGEPKKQNEPKVLEASKANELEESDNEVINPAPSSTGGYGISSNDVQNDINEPGDEPIIEIIPPTDLNDNIQPETSNEENNNENNENVNINASKNIDGQRTNDPSEDFFNYGNLPPFFKEIKSGDIQVIEDMIKINLVTQEKSSNGYNALHYAASLMKVDIMKLFLEKGLFKATDTIDVGDFEGNTPLHLVGLAAKYHPKRVVEAAELLDAHGADIKAKDAHDYAPIFCAIVGNSVDLVEYLLSKGESIASTATRFETSLLHFAMNVCHRPMIKFLIDNGAKTDYVSMLNRAPIHEAAAAGCVDGLRELILTRRVDKQTKSPSKDKHKYFDVYEEHCLFGASPLHFAGRFNQIKTVEFLFLIQADFHARDDSGDTAQDLAELTNDSKEVRDYFIDRFEWEKVKIHTPDVENYIRSIDESNNPENIKLYEYYKKRYLHKQLNK